MKNKQRNSFTYYSTKKIISTSSLKKYLTVSLIVLLTVVSNSCLDFTSTKNKVLPIVALNQWYIGWCGAACVEMWADFRGISGTPTPEQDVIVEVTGVYTNTHLIALAVTEFTRDLGSPRYYTSSKVNQAIAAQVASISDGIPSIPIVQDGFHAVIMKGYRWSEWVDFRPLAEGIHFNDPLTGSSEYTSVGDWKYFWFTSMDGMNWAVVFGSAYYEYEDQGREGLNEFHSRDGIIYGEDPGDGDEDPPPIIV